MGHENKATGGVAGGVPTVLLALLTRLPLPLLHWIASLLPLMAPFVAPKLLRQIDHNLGRAFPELDPASRQRLLRQAALNLADLAVEAFKAYSIDESALNARVRITNIELLDHYVRANQSVMVVGGHEANWEWVLLSCSSQLPFEIQCAYKPARGPILDGFMRTVRGRFGAVLFPTSQAGRAIIDGRKSLRALVLTPDEKPSSGDDYRIVSFLNQDTAFRSSFERLAILWRYPVLFAARRRIARGRYEVTFQTLGEPPYNPANCDLVEAFAAALERSILAQPSDWLWTQRRWEDESPPSA